LIRKNTNVDDKRQEGKSQCSQNDKSPGVELNFFLIVLLLYFQHLFRMTSFKIKIKDEVLRDVA
jgi:hypothetical protein